MVTLPMHCHSVLRMTKTENQILTILLIYFSYQKPVFFSYSHTLLASSALGWSDGAMVLGKLPVPGILLIWIRVGQGPTALAVGAGRGCLDIFFLSSIASLLSPSR